MLPELTNLLPSERRTRMKREYWFRFGTVASFMLAVALIAHAALLIPSYLYLQSQAATYTARVQELSAARAAAGYEDLTSRIKALSDNANRIIASSGVPSGSDTIRAVLALPRTGISISSFAFTPGSGTGDGKMTLVGMASTREALRSFDLSLRSLSFVRTTDLPLSAYAKESDIPFTIALTLTFTP